MLTRDLIVFYSKAFAGNDINRAKKILKSNQKNRTHDKVASAYSLGWVTCNLVLLIYLKEPEEN